MPRVLNDRRDPGDLTDGTVARIRLDEVADSYILVSHLEPAAKPNQLRGTELASAA